MSTNPVPSWNRSAWAGSEASFGTVLDPAASQLMEVINFKAGPAEQGNTRGVKDRSAGREMQLAFVEGRTDPIAWSMDLSQKSRAAIDSAAAELPLFKAAGLKQTLNASTSAVYSLVADPLASGDFASATLRRVKGHSANSNGAMAETLFGAYVESLTWSGGDKELSLAVSGKAAGKRTSGAIDSVTLTLEAGPSTMTVSAADSWKLVVGEYYIVETEIVKVTAVTHGSTSATIARAQLTTSAAAHTAKPLYPYSPAVSALTGRPLSEAVVTCSIGGVTTRILSWEISIKTGIKGLPGESGSSRIQGVSVGLLDITAKTRLQLKGDDVPLFEKAHDRSTAGAIALSIVQGSGTGGVATFSLPYCEIIAPESPDTTNDAEVVDISYRVRGNAGNDAMTLTLT